MSASKVRTDRERPADVIQDRDPGLLKPHPEAELIPQMTPDEYDALVEDVERRGITDPLVVTEDDIVLDGRHRLMAARAIGLETVPVRVFKGDESAQRDFMLRAALLRRHLTIAQRKDLAAKLIVTEPEKSDRSIAKATGISRPTVATIRDDLEAQGQVAESATSSGADGKTYPRPVVVPDEPNTPAAEIATDYDELIAHADDPKVRYRLGEKLNGEKVNRQYPKGRLKAIAKSHGVLVKQLREHVAYWEEANLGQDYLRQRISLSAERWLDLDDVVSVTGLSYSEVVSTMPALERRKMQALLRKAIENLEKTIEALR
jgi:ParB-like chromosome segregation protein Spo0J